jgi:uncharacterized protein YaiI (UPF0178 family)
MILRKELALVLTIYIDADACPVKDEVYRVAKRYSLRVLVVTRTHMKVPAGPLVELVVRPGFEETDDWIATQACSGDLVVTADIPLAARCLEKGAMALDPKGNPFTEADIGSALAMRELMSELRQTGVVTGGPAPMTPRDRSRFLSKLDEAVNALLRKQ